MKEIYPVTILFDRYGGVYSGGNWIAFNMYREDVPFGVGGSDSEEMEVYDNLVYGKGNTPNEALEDLRKALSNPLLK